MDCPHGVIAGTLQKDMSLCTLPLQVRGRVCERGGSFVCVWVCVGGGGERRGEAVACDHPTGGSGALTGATESPGGWGAWLMCAVASLQFIAATLRVGMLVCTLPLQVRGFVDRVF